MIWFASSEGRVVLVNLDEEIVQFYATVYPKVNYFFAELVTE